MLDRIKAAASFLLGGVAVSGAKAYFGGGNAYDAGSYGQREMADWYPSIGAADDEILSSRDLTVSRARDLYRNHPVVHGAVDKIADAVIGNRVQLDAKPVHDLLKRDLEWAIDWALNAQAEFKVWAYSPRFECDVAGQNTFGQMMRTAVVTRIVDGETFLVLRNRNRGGRYSTCIELIDPDRVSNPLGLPDNHKLPNGNTLYAGIEYSASGEPMAYHVRVKHPAKALTEVDQFRWVRITRRTASGKPQVIHSFRQHRSNQRRGVSALVPVIKRVRMNDNYDIAELEAALFDAINAGFVESPYPSQDVAAGMAPAGGGEDTGWSLSKQLAYREKAQVALKGVRMNMLLPGEKMNFKAPARPAGNYPAFKGAGQHDLAAGVGLSYPQVSEDWADINYSSARTLLNEKWRGFDSVGEEITSQICSPIWDALLEEMIAVGTVKMPGGAAKFRDNRALIAFCGWLRPGRGTIDPMKEEQAADIAINGNRSNSYLECARNGLDFYEVALGAATEEIVRKKLNLSEFVPLKIAGAAGGADGAAGDTGPGTEQDRDGDGKPNENQTRKQGEEVAA
jgi:lambda family phage portal protein